MWGPWDPQSPSSQPWNQRWHLGWGGHCSYVPAGLVTLGRLDLFKSVSSPKYGQWQPRPRACLAPVSSALVRCAPLSGISKWPANRSHHFPLGTAWGGPLLPLLPGPCLVPRLCLQVWPPSSHSDNGGDSEDRSLPRNMGPLWSWGCVLWAPEVLSETVAQKEARVPASAH